MCILFIILPICDFTLYTYEINNNNNNNNNKK